MYHLFPMVIHCVEKPITESNESLLVVLEEDEGAVCIVFSPLA
jgi:hypothetical protein